MLPVFETELAATQHEVCLVTRTVSASPILEATAVIHAVAIPDHGVLKQIAAGPINFRQLVV